MYSKAFMDRVNIRLQTLEGKVGTLEASSESLKATMGTLKGEFGTLKATMGTLEGSIGVLTTTMQTVGDIRMQTKKEGIDPKP